MMMSVVTVGLTQTVGSQKSLRKMYASVMMDSTEIIQVNALISTNVLMEHMLVGCPLHFCHVRF